MTDRKRTAQPDWEDLRYFLNLARHGSLSATARALRVNHATVARRIASLEACLGYVLFDRRADGYALTVDGQGVLDEASAMERASVALVDRLGTGAAVSGLVRLTTIRALADRVLIPGLRDFHRRYPAIALEILVDTRVLSLARREADLALRLGNPRDSELTGRLVGRVTYGYYASHAWAARLAGGETPPLIGYDEDSDAFVPESRWLKTRFAAARFSFRANSQTSQAEAAKAGFGIALLPHYLAADEPDLAAVACGEAPPERAIWLLMRPDLAKAPRIRAVADAIAGLFSGERRRFAGAG